LTYNFDPDRWLESRLRALAVRLERGEIDRATHELERERLHRRHEAMVDRLDGTFTLPGSGG
jgi:hypothetical protein